MAFVLPYFQNQRRGGNFKADFELWFNVGKIFLNSLIKNDFFFNLLIDLIGFFPAI